MEDSLGDIYYYCHDAQYSVTVMLDDAGDIAERYEYTPYGKTDVCTDPGTDSTWFTGDDEYAAANEIGNPYRFTGRRFDSESGMYYFRNRMWSGEMGRFASRDPASYIDGYNLYAGWFVVNRVDPKGSWCFPLGRWKCGVCTPDKKSVKCTKKFWCCQSWTLWDPERGKISVYKCLVATRTCICPCKCMKPKCTGLDPDVSCVTDPGF